MIRVTAALAAISVLMSLIVGDFATAFAPLEPLGALVATYPALAAVLAGAPLAFLLVIGLTPGAPARPWAFAAALIGMFALIAKDWLGAPEGRVASVVGDPDTLATLVIGLTLLPAFVAMAFVVGFAFASANGPARVAGLIWFLAAAPVAAVLLHWSGAEVFGFDSALFSQAEPYVGVASVVAQAAAFAFFVAVFMGGVRGRDRFV